MIARYFVAVALYAVGCAEPESGNFRSNTPPKTGGPTAEKTPSGDGRTGSKPDASPSQTIPTAPEGAATLMTDALIVKPGAIRFSLASVDNALQGGFFTAQLTINPAAGAIPESISLRDLRVESPQSSGLSFVNPSLVVQAAGKERDLPFGRGISMQVPKARIVPLGGVPAVTIEMVGTGDQVRLRFAAITKSDASQLDGVPSYRECKAPGAFRAVADGLKPCQSCHSGLFSYEFMDSDLATACGLNLKLIDAKFGRVPTIPNGVHKGLDTSIVRSAVFVWKNAEAVD